MGVMLRGEESSTLLGIGDESKLIFLLMEV